MFKQGKETMLTSSFKAEARTLRQPRFSKRDPIRCAICAPEADALNGQKSRMIKL